MFSTYFKSLFDTTANGTTVSVGAALLALLAALALGAVIAGAYLVKNKDYTKSFVITLVMLPAVVQSVIMLVNSNIGMSIAVLGTFSLVRFRSAPGTAKEICAIFFAMAVGLATGAGQIQYAAVLTVILAAVMIGLNFLPIGKPRDAQRQLTIVIPETLNYVDVFDDLFATYTEKTELQKVKTTNMGSMFELRYLLTLRDVKTEKAFLDALRERNGNLPITCGKILPKTEEM